MGLCKCPKRKVTNQFCFEHCVNVCEYCMVTNHPKCVIQSYLQWLQDSDCNPICTFCNENLNRKECCRLTCYHVYHWSCLDAHFRNLPEESPSNYVCPTCNIRVIPQANLVSPVADVLRDKLSGVNWARSAQGLPLLSDEIVEKPEEQTHNVLNLDNGQSSLYQNHVTSTMATSRTSSMVMSTNSQTNSLKLGPPYSVVNMLDTDPSNPTMRRVFEAYDDTKDDSIDHDDFKYQRKSAIESFWRWWKLITRHQPQRRNSPKSLAKRYVIIIICIVVVYILITFFTSKFGSTVTDGDPMFDPINDPMINVLEKND